MRIFKSIILMGLLSSSCAFAAPPLKKVPLRKPSQAEAQGIRVHTVYGDKETTFVLAKERIGGKLYFSNSEGSKNSRDLSPVDYTYLKKRLTALKGTNDRAFCSRNFTEIEIGKRTVIGCLGSGNALANEIQEIVNLMALLF